MHFSSFFSFFFYTFFTFYIIGIYVFKRANSTLVGNSNDPPRKYCILDVIKRLKNQSRLVKTGRTWSKLVETGRNWSKLSKLVETCNGLPCSKTNRTFIWTFRNLIFLLSDTSNHGWHSMFYESLIILNISTLNFSEGVPASVASVFCYKHTNKQVLI